MTTPFLSTPHHGHGSGCSCDGCSLVRTILLNPDEDVPRSMYADWLMENNLAERAELIQAGCQIEKWNCTFKQTPEQPGWKHNCGTDENHYWLCQPLRYRERELIEIGRGAKWWDMKELRCVSVDSNSHLIWAVEDGPYREIMWGIIHRGFIDELHLPVASFTDELCAAVWSRFPVTAIRFTDTIIYPSGGNDTYYFGGWHQFPQEWRKHGILEGHRSRHDAMLALSIAAVRHGREIAGVRPVDEPVTV